MKFNKEQKESVDKFRKDLPEYAEGKTDEEIAQFLTRLAERLAKATLATFIEMKK